MRLGDPLGDARREAGDAAVEQALAQGRAMQDDQIVRYALQGG